MQKVKIIGLAILPVLTIFSSCQKVLKDPLDYYPHVETVSTIQLNDGSIEITGRIVDEGATPVEYIGFCMDTVSDFEMDDNQLFAATISGNEFKAVYSGFEMYKRYYFKAWATNETGYSYGNTIIMDSIEANINPPCSPPNNSFDYGSFPMTFNYFYVPTQANDWTISAETINCSIDLEFSSKPLSKIYTSSSSLTGPKYVRVSFHQGSIGGILSDGGKVYVKQTNPNKWVVTICNEPWVYSGNTMHLTTKFTCQ